jgi:hypothetical protein
MAGVLYTRDRAAKLGTIEDGNCSLCHNHADTQAHRVMECPFPGNNDKDNKGKAAWKRLGDSDTPIVPERCLTTMKWPAPRLLPDTYEFSNHVGSDSPFRFHDRSPIYIDGSGMHGKNIEVETAASAAVQTKISPEVGWNAVSWPIPDDIDQTSVVSEILALLITLRHLETSFTLSMPIV